MEEVRGGKELSKLAQAGMALFAAQKEDEVELDLEGAKAFKADADAKIKALHDEAAALPGKENAKNRRSRSKEAAEIKNTDVYIDAEKVCKGKSPKHGNFATFFPAEVEAAPAAAEADVKADKAGYAKKEKPKKAQESAGISKAEKDKAGYAKKEKPKKAQESA